MHAALQVQVHDEPVVSAEVTFQPLLEYRHSDRRQLAGLPAGGNSQGPTGSSVLTQSFTATALQPAVHLRVGNHPARGVGLLRGQQCKMDERNILRTMEQRAGNVQHAER